MKKIAFELHFKEWEQFQLWEVNDLVMIICNYNDRSEYVLSACRGLSTILTLGVDWLMQSSQAQRYLWTVSFYGEGNRHTDMCLWKWRRVEMEYDCRLLGTVLGRISISWGGGSDGLLLRCEEFKTQPQFFVHLSHLRHVSPTWILGPIYSRCCAAEPLTDTRRATNLEHGTRAWCPSGGPNMEGFDVVLRSLPGRLL